MVQGRRPRRRSLSLGLAAGLALVLLAPAAAAEAVRYAHPLGGTVEPCTEAVPCDLHTAIEDAPAGDTVIVRSTINPYDIGADDINVAVANLTVRGEPGQPRPLITGTPAFTVFFWGGANGLLEDVRIVAPSSEALGIGSGGTVARNLNVEAAVSSYAVRVQAPATLERSEVVTTASSGTGVLLGNGGLLRDSFVRATDSVGTGVATATGISGIRNSTIVATGAGSNGIFTNGCFGMPQDLSIRNSIVDAVGLDINVGISCPPADIEYTITHSNFDPAKVFHEPPTATVTQVAPNQDSSLTPPMLTNPVTGDFHQLAGSPTIDAGSPDALTGAFDIDGQPRTMGAAIDIGGDEFQPAVETPQAKPRCKKGFKLKKVKPKKKGKKPKKKCVKVKKKKKKKKR